MIYYPFNLCNALTEGNTNPHIRACERILWYCMPCPMRRLDRSSVDKAPVSIYSIKRFILLPHCQPEPSRLLLQAGADKAFWKLVPTVFKSVELKHQQHQPASFLSFPEVRNYTTWSQKEMRWSALVDLAERAVGHSTGRPNHNCPAESKRSARTSARPWSKVWKGLFKKQQKRHGKLEGKPSFKG